MFHLLILHYFGSTSSGGRSFFIKTFFFQKFFLKDLNLLLVVFFAFIFVFPIFLIEEENFLRVDLISSPLHIKPEWYFLFLYSILRRVPSKLIGILIMFCALLFFLCQSIFRNVYLGLKYKNLYWNLFVVVFWILTGLGAVSISLLVSRAVIFLSFFYFLGLGLNRF